MKQILPGLWEIDEIGDRVHCYLWEWSGGLTLIDTGHPSDAATILQALRKRGYALHNIRRIIITHVDPDHSGGLAQLKKATGAVVACHVVEKQIMEEPWRRRPGRWWIWPLFYMLPLLPSYNQLAVRPDELLVDGQELPEGFTVIHTPGHTPGHIALLHKELRLLLVGDLLANTRNQLRINEGPFTPDTLNARRSVWKLAKKYGDDFETIVFGHGPPIQINGGKRIKALVSQIFSTDV